MENEITAQTNITQIAEGDNNMGEKIVQSPDVNREFARIRREQEKEKFKKELTDSVVLKTANEILGVNPLTSKEFLTVEEYNNYLSDKKVNIEKETDKKENSNLENKTEIQNNDIFQKNQQNIAQNEKNSDTSDDWYIKDKQDFFKQNPEFDEEKFVNLISDTDFCEFAQNKVGKMPLGDIYNDYNFLLKKVEIMSQQKAHQMYLKRFSSPGSLSSIGYNNPKVWSSMSEQEFENAIKNAKNGMYKNN